MTALDHSITRVLRRSRYACEPRRLATLTGADLGDVAEALADLVERGIVREVPGRRGPRFEVAAKPSAAPARRLTDAERLAAGLGTVAAPLPMGPLASPMRRAAA